MKNEGLKVSTPGRICLFGEHQDYLNLPIIASAISLRISIEGEKRKDNIINIVLPDLNEVEKIVLTDKIEYKIERDYFRSCINVLKRKGLTFSQGFNCVVKGEIPINAGTSSSSALVVTWINFLARMSDQEKEFSSEDIALFAYEAEVLEFTEPGGMMDQYSTAIGGVIYLDSFPEITVEKMHPNLKSFVLGNSNEPKDTKFILQRVKVQVMEVVKSLQETYPDFSLQTVTAENFKKFGSNLNKEQYELLEGTIKNRDITRIAKLELEKEEIDHKYIGELLNKHQTVLRDILKISTPKIDKMIERALEAGAYGAKINGSGGGGCMFAYAPENPEKVSKAIEEAGGESFLIYSDSGTKAETNGEQN